MQLLNIEITTHGCVGMAHTLSLQGCKESRSPFLSEWEVWKKFLQVF
jgi:hypothetical protein